MKDPKCHDSNSLNSEGRYRSIFINAKVPIFILKNGIFLECNKETLKIFEAEYEDLIGRSPIDFSPVYQPDGKESAEQAQIYIDRAMHGEDLTFEWTHIKLDGTAFETEVNLSLLNSDNNSYLQANVRNISYERNNLRLLKESEERYRILAENNMYSTIVSSADGTGRLFYANNVAAEFFGVDRANINQLITIDFWYDQKDRIAFLHEIRKNGFVSNKEIEVVSITGDPKTILLSSNIIEYRGEKAILSIFADISDYKTAIRLLLENEERLRLISNLSESIVYQYNFETNTVKWSGAIEKVVGAVSSDINLMTFDNWNERIHPDDVSETIYRFSHDLLKNNHFCIEYRFLSDRDSYIWIEEECFLQKTHKNDGKKAIGVMRDINARKEMERLILSNVIKTEESERMHFSQELHDGIGPLLSAIKMYVQWLGKPNSNISSDEILNDITNLLDEATQTVRDISFKLSPHVLQNYGLGEAIKIYVAKMEASNSIVFKLNIDQLDQKYSNTNNDADVIIYRVICECITNTIKHAEAKVIDIDVVFKDNMLLLTYKDDGKGFDMHNANTLDKGIGLLNMKSRIKSINGKMEISSKPGYGTLISLKIEYPKI